MAPRSAVRRLAIASVAASWLAFGPCFSSSNLGATLQATRAGAAKQPRAEAIARRGWADPNWNWGSAVGDAHDLAMGVRSKLSTTDIRMAWLADLEDGNVDIEEFKLALGLRMQQAARQGMEGDGAGLDLMQDMAKCKYEAESGEALLAADLRLLIKALEKEEDIRLPPDYGEPDADASFGIVAARAMIGIGFGKGGC